MRPTEARLREALLSIWSQLIPGASFLDLFAGSGAVGLEASSRGAGEVLLVESSSRVVKSLGANVERLGGEGCRVIRAELPAGLARLAGRCFDLIFADPPYAFGDYGELLAGAGELLGEDGQLAVEHARRRELPHAAGPLERFDERVYGDKVLSFYRR